MTDWKEIEGRVAAAWEDRGKLQDPVHRAAVVQALHGLDRGELRVAAKVGGEWKVNAWLMQAVNLFFAVSGMETKEYGPFQIRDKIPLKKDLEKAGVRLVPGGIARYGSYLAPGAVLLPGFVNIGARVGAGHDGRHVGDGRLLRAGGRERPPRRRRRHRRRARAARRPPEHHRGRRFIGSRCIVVEGTLVEEEAVLGANMVITASTPIIDVTGAEGGRLQGARAGALGGHPRHAPEAVPGRQLPASRARSSSASAARRPTRRSRSTRRCATSRCRSDGAGAAGPASGVECARAPARRRSARSPSPIGHERALCDALEAWAAGAPPARRPGEGLARRARSRRPGQRTTSESFTRSTRGWRARSPGLERVAERALVADRRRDRAERLDAARERVLDPGGRAGGVRRRQTCTSKSRSAWLSETFLSVAALRLPTMSAQGIW